MKISCTIDEFRTIIENCYDNRVLSGSPCAKCVLHYICKDSDGIAADIEIVKED